MTTLRYLPPSKCTLNPYYRTYRTAVRRSSICTNITCDAWIWTRTWTWTLQRTWSVFFVQVPNATCLDTSEGSIANWVWAHTRHSQRQSTWPNISAAIHRPSVAQNFEFLHLNFISCKAFYLTPKVEFWHHGFSSCHKHRI